MHRSGKIISKTTWYAGMIIVAFIMLYPLIFSLLAGLNTRAEFGHMGALFPVPSEPQFQNLLFMFSLNGLRPLLNTFLRTGWYTVIVCIMSVLIGYVLARYKFKGKQFFIFAILGAQVIPSVLTLIPAFIFMSRIPFVGGNDWTGYGGNGLINNPLSIFLPLGWGFLIWVFLFMQTMKAMPKDFEEAAQIDGCGFWRTIFQVIIPMNKPIIAVIAVNVALSVWNDWLTPFLYISNIQYSTLPAYLGMLTSQLQQFGENDYPRLFAMSTVATIPPLLIFLFLQRYIIEGIASAGVKG